MALRVRERLRLTKQFLAIRRRGVWARGRLLSVGALPNRLPTSRLGLRVQRGTKGSVLRNRAKRLCRVVYQRQKNRLKPGYDLLVIIHQANGISLHQLEESFVEACRKLGLL